MIGRRAHIEKAKGSRKDNWTYCTKEDELPFTNFLPSDKPVLKYRELLPEPYAWQLKMISLLASEATDRAIHWVWCSEGKSGKTRLTKHVVSDQEDAILLPAKTADMQHAIAKYYELQKQTPRIVLINVPRTSEDFLNYGGLESIKDMCFYSGKYEGGMIVGKCPHMCIFANFPPNEGKMSRDRWVVREIVNKDIESF